MVCATTPSTTTNITATTHHGPQNETDSGVNWDACKLEHGEALLMRRDLVCATNLVRSYKFV